MSKKLRDIKKLKGSKSFDRVSSQREKKVRFLIVCEGKRTEPNYFKALVKDKFSEVRDEEIQGEGSCTVSLVKRTTEIKKELEEKRQLPFDRIWVVFDKDSFNDFNDAIQLAKKLKYSVAWSNEAFELWYYLHFQYLDTKISRHDYIKRLENEIRRYDGYKTFSYKKNDPKMYRLLNDLGNEGFAKKNAVRLRKMFVGSKDYNSHQPCTQVDLLVDELENPEKVIAMINSETFAK